MLHENKIGVDRQEPNITPRDLFNCASMNTTNVYSQMDQLSSTYGDTPAEAQFLFLKLE